MRVLIVDDDRSFRRILERGLAADPVELTSVASAEAALDLLHSLPRGHFDLVLLDVTLPGGANGIELLRELRRRGARVPVIFVTSRAATEEKIAGLGAGADDWLVKPFALDELRARIEAVMRRQAHNQLEYGDLRVDLERQRVTRGGTSVDLSRRDLEVLVLLMRAKGDTVARADLLREIWELPFDPGTNVIDVQIGRLRRKLDRHGAPCIESVRGVGFRLVAAPSLD